MVRNLSKNARFFCMNGHKKPIPMVIKEGNDQFYACPKYMRKDENHPEGREEDERMCMNHISFSDAIDIMNTFSDLIEDDVKQGVLGQYAGMTFQVRRITVTVLKYNVHTLDLGVYNARTV